MALKIEAHDMSKILHSILMKPIKKNFLCLKPQAKYIL